jgi:predicted hydrocarbon binding protein
MSRTFSLVDRSMAAAGLGIWTYCAEQSQENEHHFTVYGNASCWGLEAVGTSVGAVQLGALAGVIKALERGKRDWNVFESRCIGRGDPCCEVAVSARGHAEADRSFHSLSPVLVAKVRGRLLDHFCDYLVGGHALAERKGMDQSVFASRMLTLACIPAIADETFLTSLRLAGVRLGVETARRMLDAGFGPEETVARTVRLLNEWKVGIVTAEDTFIRIQDNCETFGLTTGEKSCHFTTGFLNGLHMTLSGRSVRETRCVGDRDEHCEWRIS